MRRTTRISATIAAVAAGAILTACSSYKSANPGNFTRALNGYYADHDDCLFSSALHFPYEVSTKAASVDLVKKLNALAGAGLLQKTEEPAIQVNRYSLTTYASTHSTGRFCYGHRVVTSIDRFTPPANVQGQQTVQVEYQYKMMDVPGWAQSQPMLAAFPSLAKDTSGQPRDATSVVLTSVGWRVPE